MRINGTGSGLRMIAAAATSLCVVASANAQEVGSGHALRRHADGYPGTCSIEPRATRIISCIPTAITIKRAIIRRRRSIPTTCTAWRRRGFSRPKLSIPWKPRQLSSTASCMRRRRSIRSTRSTRRPVRNCGTTSTRWVRSRPIAVARTIAASRCLATWSILPRSTPSLSGSMQRPARRSGMPRSPIRNSAIPRPWRRPRLTAKSSLAPMVASTASAFRQGV